MELTYRKMKVDKKLEKINPAFEGTQVGPMQWNRSSPAIIETDCYGQHISTS